MKINVSELVQRMSDFSITTNNDKLSNVVAHVSHRLAHQGALCEKPLSAHERAVIRAFINTQPKVN